LNNLSPIKISQIVVLCFLVIVTAVSIYPLQQELEKQLEELRVTIISLLEKKLDRKITYESISPSFLRFLEFRELSVLEYENGPSLVSFRRVRVHFSLFEIIKGNSLVSALEEIQIIDTNITFGTKKDNDLIQLFKDLVSTVGDEEVTIPSLRLSGRNISGEIITDFGTVHFESVQFSIDYGEEDLELFLRGIARGNFKKNDFQLEQMETVLEVEGYMDNNFAWSNLEIDIKQLHTNLLSLKNQTFYVNVAENTWKIRKIEDKAPIDIVLTVDLLEESLEASMVVEEFVPSQFVTLEEGLASFDPWMNTLLTGEASIRYFYSTSRLTYEGDISAHLDNSLLPTSFNVKGNFNGNEKFVDFANLDVVSEYGNYSFKGGFSYETLLPNGYLEFYNLPYPITDTTARGAIILASKNRTLQGRSTYLSLGDASFSSLDVTITRLEGGIDFSLEGSTESFRNQNTNSFNSEGYIEFSPEIYLQLSFSSKNLPIRDVLPFFVSSDSLPKDVFQFAEPLLLSSELYINSNLKQVSFASPKVDIRDISDPNNSLYFASSGNASSFEIRELELHYSGIDLSGEFQADIVEQNFLRFSSQFSVQDVPYSFSGSFKPGKELIVQGDYDFSSILLFSDERILLSLDCSELPVPLPENQIFLSLSLHGSYISLDKWQIALRKGSISSIPLQGAPPGSLALNGRITSENIIINRLIYTDTFSVISGSGMADINLLNPNKGEAWINLQSEEGGETYYGYAKIHELGENHSIDGLLSFKGSPLSRFIDTNIIGNVNGKFLVKGSIDSPEITGSLSLEEGLLNADPVSFATDFTLSQERGIIHSLSLDYLTNSVRGARGTYSIKNGTLAFTADYQGVFQADPITARLELAGSFQDFLPLLGSTDLFTINFEVNLHVTDIFVGEEEQPSWEAVLRQQEEKITFSGGPEDSINGYFEKDGVFYAELREPMPIECIVTGSVKDAVIDAELKDGVLSFKALDSLLIIPFFKMSEGQAYGTLSIKGPINDPDFYGTLEGAGVFATVPVSPDTIGPLESNIVFNGKTMSIERTTVKVGAGYLTAEAMFTMDHWLPVTADIRISTTDDRAVHIKTNIGRILVDGYASGNFRVVSEPIGISLFGNLQAKNTSIMIGQKGEEDEEQVPNISLDLTVTSGQQVEFIWPNQDFPILQAYAETGESVSILLDGTNGEATFRGEVDIKGGEIYYFSRSFYINEGKIVFNENEDKFDPRLSARAELRDVTPEGTPLSIYLIEDDKPFSEFSPYFESDPPLSNADILSILGKGLMAQLGGETIDLSKALIFTGDFFLTQFGLIKSFENAVKDIFSLDLFTLRTQILQNLLRERLFQEQIAQEALQEQGLGRYLDNTTLFLGKYFGNDLFIEAMLRLRMSNNYIEELKAYEELQIESKISLEWKTPLALIELNFQPDFEDIFSTIAKASVALSWRFAF
jgi:translocation and assembly module TamB